MSSGLGVIRSDTRTRSGAFDRVVDEAAVTLKAGHNIWVLGVLEKKATHTLRPHTESSEFNFSEKAGLVWVKSGNGFLLVYGGRYRLKRWHWGYIPPGFPYSMQTEDSVLEFITVPLTRTR